MKAPARFSLASLGAHLGLFWWAVAVTVGSSGLLGRHLLTLPLPPPSATEEAIGRSRLPAERGRWLAIHVLYDACPCSQKVLDHLLGTARPEGVAERILWVGSASPRIALAEAKGLRVTRVTAEELASAYHMEAAPLLVVAEPGGRVRYSGGYSARKQGADLRDLQIISGLRGDRDQQALPLFGCAVSQRLQRTLDPISRLTDAL